MDAASDDGLGTAAISLYNGLMANGNMTLTDAQIPIARGALNRKLWLEGIAGSGKTTTAVQRVLYLLERGVPAESILVFLPQRSLAEPYIRALRGAGYNGGQVAVHTIGSLSLQMVELFWFLVAERAGFKHPQDLPNFLSLELVQYFMTRAIEPLINQRDYFNSVRIDRARLYSQIIDNMNKAALVDFPHQRDRLALEERLDFGRGRPGAGAYF